jgi:hypothetical protein
MNRLREVLTTGGRSVEVHNRSAAALRHEARLAADENRSASQSRTRVELKRGAGGPARSSRTGHIIEPEPSFSDCRRSLDSAIGTTRLAAGWNAETPEMVSVSQSGGWG